MLKEDLVFALFGFSRRAEQDLMRFFLALARPLHQTPEGRVEEIIDVAIDLIRLRLGLPGARRGSLSRF